MDFVHKILERHPYAEIWRELSYGKRMVFLSGPRQSNSLYFNWDVPRNKALLVNNPTFFDEMPRTNRALPLVVLDEIHKYNRWKNYLKGIYDEFHDSYQDFLIANGNKPLFLVEA